MGNIPFTICGEVFALRETTKKDGKGTYHAFRLPNRTSGAFGVTLAPLEDELPSEVVVGNTRIALTKGLTAASFKDRKTGETVVVPEHERRVMVSHEGEHELVPGVKKHVTVRISETKDENWNIKAVVTKPRSVSPEERKQTARERAQANLALLRAELGMSA